MRRVRIRLFAAGIIGTGLLAVPVLAGSAAYAVAETFRWPTGLGLPLAEARGFYAILTAATALGVLIDLSGIDSIKALLVVTLRLKVLGWLAVGVIAAAVAAMLALL